MGNGKYTMTDIHMHLVPGVDDGAMDPEMALAMIFRAQEQGIDTIFATPHADAFHRDPEEVWAQFRKLKILAGRIVPEVKILPGCEVYCEKDRMGAVLDALDKGVYPTMNGTGYVLMEFSMWVRPENTLCCVQALAEAGWKPILAHAERYRHLRGDMALLDRFRAAGCKIQINAYSLVEEAEDSIRHWARRIILEQKADFLGTDAHRTYHRPPSAETGLRWIYENCSRAYADALAFGNARRLLGCGEGENQC